MRRGFIRRAAGRGRSARTARSGSGSVYRDSSGHQYRVVQVDESDTSEFADPPRKWPRVGLMATTWALILALGTWIAPAFAASGNDENKDPREVPITDAIGAAWSYLEYGSTEKLDLAQAAMCDGASPAVTPSDLDELRKQNDAELGGIERINLDVKSPVEAADGLRLAGTVFYVYQGEQSFKDFTITVQEADGVYCVSNAVEESEGDGPSSDPTTVDAADPQELATEFMRTIVVKRDPQAATGFQCTSYTGITPEDLDAAITAWADDNGETTTFLNGVQTAETSETSMKGFNIEATLDGDLRRDTYTFVVGVQGDCVASLEGGGDLI